MGQFDLANRIKINNPSGDNDLMYGPYVDKATALSTVVSGLRDKGRRVGILNNGAVSTAFPIDSVGVRGLTGSLWDNINSFSITLNQLKYSIVLRAGKNLLSVVTQNNENITTNFVNSGTINVLLADGVTTQSYTIYNFESATIMNVNATVTLS